MSSQCVIRFNNNPLGVFFTGQLVSGVVELTTSKPKTIKFMQITITGHAEVRWNENVSKKNAEGKTESVNESFIAEESYFCSTTYVQGQSTGDSISLAAGRYTYPFQITLPPNSPTSMNGPYGHIRYEVVFTIDRPLRYNNVFKQPFTVISPLDLNLNPSYARPIEQKEQKTFCWTFCCGNNDPIVMTVTIPYNGFVPGQKIPFTISVDNESNIDCTEVKVKVEKISKFTCRTPETKEKVDCTKLNEIRLGSVLKLSKNEFKDHLQIPPTQPSTLETCAIIRTEYKFRIILKISGLHTNLKTEIPITIGTIPLYASFNAQNNAITSQPEGTQIQSFNMPQPSYEEDFNKEKFFVIADEYNKFAKNVNFIPKYPYYYNSQSGGNQLASQNVGQQNVTGHLNPNIPPPQYPSSPSPQYPTNPGPQYPTNVSPQYPITPASPYPTNPASVNIAQPGMILPPAQPVNDNQPNQIGWKA